MNLDEYQEKAKATAVYPRDGLMSYVYPALGLAGESGEVVDKIKKVVRNGGDFTEQRIWEDKKKEIAKELGDVLWYVAILADELGYTLEGVASMNLAKLADRKERDVLKGEGDNR